MAARFELLEHPSAIGVRARGERLDVARHEFRTAVKTVTYHQFESHQTRDGWEIRVFVDV